MTYLGTLFIYPHIRYMVYVYELINEIGIVEYVGTANDPEFRYRRHVYYKPNIKSNTGKFYQRFDLKLNVVKNFTTKSEAWHYQCKLQKEYGLVTDAEKLGWPGNNKKFTFEIVEEIRLKYQTGNYTIKALAQEYLVTSHPIRMIILNRTYKKGDQII